MQSGRVVPSTTSREMTTSSTPSRPGRSNMVSSRMLSKIERRPRAPVLRSIALRNRAQRLVGKRQLDVLHLEQALVLLDQRVLRIGEDPLQRSFVEILERRNHRQAANELRNEAILQEVLRFDMAEDLAGATILGRQHLRSKTDRGRTAPPGDDLFQA